MTSTQANLLKASVFLIALLATVRVASHTGASARHNSKPAHRVLSASAQLENPADLHPETALPSGRQLAEERHAARRKTSTRYEEDAYGVSLEFPKAYRLTEGDLSDMDPGLGYLGAIPMSFRRDGGVRIVTVEAPRGAYPNTDFVNAFLTVSAHSSISQDVCAQFDSANDIGKSAPPISISGISFNGIQQESAASMHQYSGFYYHGYAEGVCYEVGYGYATAGYGAVDGLRHVDTGIVTRQLQDILHTLLINPPRDEEPETSSAAIHTAQAKQFN